MIRKTSETRALAGNIVNAYSESQNSTYSCDFINGTTLYNNASGTTGEVALSDNVSNYRYLEIHFINSNNFFFYLKVPTEYTSFPISAQWGGSDGTMYWASCEKVLSTNKISTDGARYSSVYNTGSTVGGSHANELKIVKVIGYK